ncbi:alpha/beta fold hydrolase [bacterium]|nr:alpha/beta fold hydrolase [bacterium]
MIDMMREEFVSFYNKNERIVGMVHIAETQGKSPAVVMCHGFTGQRMEAHFLFVKTARRLAENGISVLRFDFRGSGESEGKFEDMTVEEEISDAETALRFLRMQEFVDCDRIGIIGLSLGGCVSACLAGRVKNLLKSVVLWSAAYKPGRDLSSILSPEAQESLERVGYVNMGGNKVGKKFFQILPTIDPIKEISTYPGAVLLVHGEADFIPYSQAEECYEVLKQRKEGKAKLHIIKGADHTFSSPEWEEEAITTTLNWFKETL